MYVSPAPSCMSCDAEPQTQIIFFFTVFSSHHTDVSWGVRGKQLRASFFGSASCSSGFKWHHHLNMVFHHMGLVCIQWEELKQPAEEVSENMEVLLEETERLQGSFSQGSFSQGPMTSVDYLQWNVVMFGKSRYWEKKHLCRWNTKEPEFRWGSVFGEL